MRHRNRARKTGLSPGSLVHIGERKVEQVGMTLIDYTPEALNVSPLHSAKEAAACKESGSVSWINVIGLHDMPLLEEIGRGFGIHSLVLEDIANTDQRPKLELGDQLFIVAKMLRIPKTGPMAVDVEQVSFIVGPRYIITFQEKEGDVFEPVRERLRQNKGRLRKCGPDYLAYALLDLIVDNYFVVLERLADEIDALEARVLGEVDPAVPHEIHRLKHTLLMMRKATWPLREMVNSLLREESPLVAAATDPFLRDLHDHTLHVLDTIETYRDMVSGLLEVHFSNINNRMGDVMKVLTIIATIFIPLTFLAGVYGMNFEHMPELGWKWSYPVALLLMAAMAIGMLAYFRAKKWL